MTVDQTDGKRRLWRMWVFLFAYGATQICVYSTESSPFAIFYISPIIGLALVLLGFGRSVPNGRPDAGWWLPLAPLALWMTWYVFIYVFGAFSIPAILFHFQYELGSNTVAQEVALQMFTAALPFALVAICWAVLARGSIGLQRFGKAAILPLLAINPFTVAMGAYLTTAYSAPQIPLEMHYAEPALATAPSGKPKNLVRILLESTERTTWDEELFGDIAAPLKRLEQRGFSATEIDQAELTGWTLAGIIASDCGLPLFSLGAINGNEFSLVKSFMPNAVCLGDLLARDGYEQVFIKGAQLKFAGTDRYLESHNYKEALGFDELAGGAGIPDNAWGLDDEQVFETALQRIEQLDQASKPYHLTLLTIGGHSPSGYVSKQCTRRPDIMKHSSETLRALACTNALTESFIKRLEQRGFLENTVVVIQSDHLAMRNEIYSELKKHKRRNTFIILGKGLTTEVSAKGASMVDVFPSTLEALDYKLPSHRAGLGTSLLSSEPTLVERIGLAAFNQAIIADTALRDRIWNLKPAI
jgi:phosphoglycerol transferase